MANFYEVAHAVQLCLPPNNCYDATLTLPKLISFTSKEAPLKNAPPPYSWNLFPCQHGSIYVGDARDSLYSPWPRHSRVKAELSLISGALSRSVPATSGRTVPRHGNDSAAATNSPSQTVPADGASCDCSPSLRECHSLALPLPGIFMALLLPFCAPFSFQPERESVR